MHFSIGACLTLGNGRRTLLRLGAVICFQRLELFAFFFPPLVAIVCFPSLVIDCMFSCTLHRLHVFPPFTSVTFSRP